MIDVLVDVIDAPDLGFPTGQIQFCQCGSPFMATSRAQYRSGCCVECFEQLRPSDPRAADTTPRVKLPLKGPLVPMRDRRVA